MRREEEEALQSEREREEQGEIELLEGKLKREKTKERPICVSGFRIAISNEI